ncbi:MAG: hypothetical protein A4E60_02484 [Syntrophorhabdus sp. PtaB.Bin047]|nr:MAG: hypothetical protein A4E60_02484 [Syntrophorhabdus sp. PtaB.Bin047]
MGTITITEGDGNFEINAIVHVMGTDILVVLGGGAVHIGAVGIGQPRPSLRDEGKISSTGSVFTFPGHKEDTVAKSMSEELARRLNRRIVVVAGLHWDRLDAADLGRILNICNRITERIVAEVTLR